jgi:hypothetical protein
MAAFASTTDHEPNRDITKEPGEQQGIDVLNSLSHFFAESPNLCWTEFGLECSPHFACIAVACIRWHQQEMHDILAGCAQ